MEEDRSGALKLGLDKIELNLDLFTRLVHVLDVALVKSGREFLGCANVPVLWHICALYATGSGRSGRGPCEECVLRREHADIQAARCSSGR